MYITRTRQKNSIEHILRGNSLQRAIMEGGGRGREEGEGLDKSSWTG